MPFMRARHQALPFCALIFRFLFLRDKQSTENQQQAQAGQHCGRGITDGAPQYCELCKRLRIRLNGQLKCLWPHQHHDTREAEKKAKGELG